MSDIPTRERWRENRNSVPVAFSIADYYEMGTLQTVQEFRDSLDYEAADKVLEAFFAVCTPVEEGDVDQLRDDILDAALGDSQ